MSSHRFHLNRGCSDHNDHRRRRNDYYRHQHDGRCLCDEHHGDGDRDRGYINNHRCDRLLCSHDHNRYSNHRRGNNRPSPG
jgi:hypothetical protein